MGRVRAWLGESWPLLPILLLAVALRVYQLDSLPPGLWFDEAANGIDAMGVLAGDRPIFFEGNQGREPLFIYVIAFSFKLFGVSLFSMRLVSVVFGLLTVAVTYALGRELFSRRVGLLAALVTAGSFWAISLSRVSFRAGSLPLFEALAALLLVRAVRSGRLALYALSGFAAGLSLYTYLASRMTPVWLALFGLLLFLPAWRRPNAVGGTSARRHLVGLSVAFIAAAITFAPLGGYFLSHPGQFWGRISAVSASASDKSDPSLPAGAPAQTSQNAPLDTLAMFVLRGDSNPRHNLPGRPVFDPFLIAPLLVGLILVFRQADRPAGALLVLWIGVMLLPGALSDEAPHALRTVGVMPAIFFLPALGLDWLWRMLKRQSVLRAARLAPVAIGLILAGSTFISADDYLGNWAKREDVYYTFLGDEAEAVRQAARLQAPGVEVYLPGWSYREKINSLGIFATGFTPERSFDGLKMFILPGASKSDTLYVYPPMFTRDDGAHCTYLACDAPEEVFYSPNGYLGAKTFRIAAGQHFEIKPDYPLNAEIGDKLLLYGYDLDRNVRPGRPVRLTLYAQVLSAFDQTKNPQLFAHLLRNTGGNNIASGYVNLLGADFHVGDRVVFWLDIVSPPGLAGGLYHLDFGVFDAGDQSRPRIIDSQGNDVGGVLHTGAIRVEPVSFETAPPSRLSNARLGETIVLVGSTFPESARAGETIRVGLQWMATVTVKGDYTIFLQALDESGKLVAQTDVQPKGGALPTGVWQPGETVADELELKLPESASGQNLRLITGLYRLETGERLPTFSQSGAPTGDAITLGEIILSK